MQEAHRTAVAERKKLHNELVDLKGQVRVFCRSRPVLDFEDSNGWPTAVNVDPSSSSVYLVVPQSGKSSRTGREAKTAQFNFDEVFGPEASQSDVFAEVKPLLQSCLDGVNTCIIAYGQVRAANS
jgi:Microtubule binding